MTRVVNLRKEKFDVYIGRAGATRAQGNGKWGNQFRLGRDGSREEVLAKYRAWIYQPERSELRSDARRELRGKVLGCWCKPQACHGDILAQIADSPEECQAEGLTGDGGAVLSFYSFRKVA